MDYLRSAYDTKMVFRTGDNPVSIRWRRAVPKARVFPDYHSFSSANWDERECKAGELGEQPGPRPWSNGKQQDNPSGQVIGCQPLRWFKDGLTTGENGALFDSSCVVPCCLEANPDYWNGFFVPDRIKVTMFQSGSPFCAIGFDQTVLTRVPGRSVWYFEKLHPNLCYYWKQIELVRNGGLVTSWRLDASYRSLVSSIPTNTASLLTFTSSPFHMTFFFPAFKTSFWTTPITAVLDGL